MKNKANKGPINAPVPVNTDTGLKRVENSEDDIMIVSDGELPTDAGEVLPQNRVSPLAVSDSNVPGDPRRVTHIDDGYMDDSLGGGYASVKGHMSAQNRMVWIVLAVMVIMCVAVGICSSVLTGYFMKKGASPVTINTEARYEEISAVVRTRKLCNVEISSGSLRGSGVITKLENGRVYMLTNYHVVKQGTPKVRFSGDDGFWETKIEGYDSYYDVAVISVESSAAPYEVYNLDGSKYFSRTVAYSEGDILVAIGNALGYGIAAYDGIVSRAAELIEYSDTDTSKTIPVLRTTAPINAGMSGGGVFDMDGNLIGLGTYRISSSSSSGSASHRDDVENTGLVVPMSVVYPVYRHIMSYGDGGDIGVKDMLTLYQTSTSGIGGAVMHFTGLASATVEYRGGKPVVTASEIAELKEGDVIKAIGGVSVLPDKDDAEPDDSKGNVCAYCGELLCYRYFYVDPPIDAAQLKFTVERDGADVVAAIPKYYRVVA